MLGRNRLFDYLFFRCCNTPFYSGLFTYPKKLIAVCLPDQSNTTWSITLQNTTIPKNTIIGCTGSSSLLMQAYISLCLDNIYFIIIFYRRQRQLKHFPLLFPLQAPIPPIPSNPHSSPFSSFLHSSQADPWSALDSSSVLLSLVLQLLDSIAVSDWVGNYSSGTGYQLLHIPEPWGYCSLHNAV